MIPRYTLRLSYYAFDDGVEARLSKRENGRSVELATVSLPGIGRDFRRAVKALRDRRSMDRAYEAEHG